MWFTICLACCWIWLQAAYPHRTCHQTQFSALHFMHVASGPSETGYKEAQKICRLFNIPTGPKIYSFSFPEFSSFFFSFVFLLLICELVKKRLFIGQAGLKIYYVAEGGSSCPLGLKLQVCTQWSVHYFPNKILHQNHFQQKIYIFLMIKTVIGIVIIFILIK